MFRVFDKNGKDVTDERDWYIDSSGQLYFETNDIDCPLYPVEELDGYKYKIV